VAHGPGDRHLSSRSAALCQGTTRQCSVITPTRILIWSTTSPLPVTDRPCAAVVRCQAGADIARHGHAAMLTFQKKIEQAGRKNQLGLGVSVEKDAAYR